MLLMLPGPAPSARVDARPPESAAPAAASPAVAEEPEHGAVWQWLHGLGLTQTRHEQAVGLRRVMGSQGGLVFQRDGVPLDVDAMSDDDVLALDRQTRGQSPVPLVAGAVAPVMTRWGWTGQKPYENAVDQLNQPGTHRTLNGRVPTREEAAAMIEKAGNRIDRIEEGHHPDGNSTHTEPHINYTIIRQRPLRDQKATVIVQPWK